MKPEQYCIQYGKFFIDYTVVRKSRKTLEIAVEPDSTVSIAAPEKASAEAIAMKVRKRARWILEQQLYFSQFQPRTPERKYLSGETHLYLGRQYRLKVVKDNDGSVKLIRGFIIVQSPHPEESNDTKSLLNSWYAARAHVKFPERISACLERFSRPELVAPNGLTVRLMRKRWGSMSPNGRLCLNVRLMCASTEAMDYVITHELCHRIEPSHNSRYFRLLHRVMSDWKTRKEKLERFLA